MDHNSYEWLKPFHYGEDNGWKLEWLKNEPLSFPNHEPLSTRIMQMIRLYNIGANE